MYLDGSNAGSQRLQPGAGDEAALHFAVEALALGALSWPTARAETYATWSLWGPNNRSGGLPRVFVGPSGGLSLRGRGRAGADGLAAGEGRRS
jgi:hypothetical protein